MLDVTSSTIDILFPQLENQIPDGKAQRGTNTKNSAWRVDADKAGGLSRALQNNCKPIMKASSVKELSLSIKAQTPIFHEKNYVGERELFGYQPLFTPNVVSFDEDNTPYIRSGTNVQRLNRQICGWENFDFTSDLKDQFSDWDGDTRGRFDGYQIDHRIVFDKEGDAYTLAQSRVLKGINSHLLMHSRNKGASWEAYKIPSRFDMPRLEFQNGSNEIIRPPMIMAASDSSLAIIQPQKNKDGSLTVGKALIIDADSFSQGGGWASNFAVSNNNLTFVVWASKSPAGSKGTPVYVARYDHLTETVSKPLLLGRAGKGVPDNHNIPAIALDSLGYLHVVLGAHHGRMYYMRSIKPSDIEKWTKPEPIGEYDPKCSANCDLYSYVALQMDKEDTLHLVSRWAGNGYHFTLSYLRKKVGKEWEPRRTLVMPFRRYYGNWYQKLSQDKRGRLFLFYAYYSGQLFLEEAQAYKKKWPEDGIVAKNDCVPSLFESRSKANPHYCNYDNLKAHDPVLLISSDGGNSWRIVTSDAF